MHEENHDELKYKYNQLVRVHETPREKHVKFEEFGR